MALLISILLEETVLGGGYLSIVFTGVFGAVAGLCGGAWLWVMATRLHPDLIIGRNWQESGKVSFGLVASIPLFVFFYAAKALQD